MFGRRRPRASSMPPAPPSHSALVAASAVYRPNTPVNNPSLAAAAAGAALRHASLSPPPPEQRTGSIPTKRMLKRSDSYSSVTSDDAPRPMVERRRSSGSLAARKFRRERPPSEPPIPPMPHDLDRKSSIRSIGSTGSHSLPTTLRGPTPKKAVRRVDSAGSMLSRGSLRGNSGSAPAPSRGRAESEVPAASVAAAAIGMRRKRNTTRGNDGDYADSVTSDLSSIAEHETEKNESGSSTRHRRREKMVPPPVREKTTTPENTETRQRARAKSLSKLESDTQAPAKLDANRPASVVDRSLSPPPRPHTASSIDRNSSASPSKLHVAVGGMMQPVKHSPPPRSLSPAKSVLKHTSATPVPLSPQRISGDTPSSTTSDRKRAAVRVSFSDEDSVASFTNSRPPIPDFDPAPVPKLPAFASIRRQLNMPDDEGQGRLENQQQPLPPQVLSISPPPSDSSDDEMMERVKKAKQIESHTPPYVNEPPAEVPELVVIQPTPKEEKSEANAIAEGGEAPPLSPGPSSAPVELNLPTAAEQPTATIGGTTEDDGEESDSDANSVYSDAMEALPTNPTVLNSGGLPSIEETLRETKKPTPLPQTRDNAQKSGTFTPPSPPLPPDFVIQRRVSNPRPPTPPKSSAKRSPVARRSSSSPSPKPRKTAQPVQGSRVLSDESSDSDSVASKSSFRRAHPRPSRQIRGGTGFRSTMRSGAPPQPAMAPRRYSSDSSDGGGWRKKKGSTGGFGRMSLRSPSPKANGGVSSSPRKRATLGGRDFVSRFADSESDDDVPAMQTRTATAPSSGPTVLTKAAPSSPRRVLRRNSSSSTAPQASPPAKTKQTAPVATGKEAAPTASSKDAAPATNGTRPPARTTTSEESTVSKKEKKSFWSFGKKPKTAGGKISKTPAANITFSVDGNGNTVTVRGGGREAAPEPIVKVREKNRWKKVFGMR